MFKIAKYLEINRSVDGVRGRGRTLLLPKRRPERAVASPDASQQAATGQAVRSGAREGAAALTRAGGQLLF